MAIEEEDEHPIFTWFPNKEDYEVQIMVAVDETTEEKVIRLVETIESNQANIKEIVDGDTVCLEQKIYRTMDLRQDMDDLYKLLKEVEDDKEAASALADMTKKARVGLLNLKAYLGQIDCIEFATAIRNEFQFKVGVECYEPWMDTKELAVGKDIEKPQSFEHASTCEENAALFLQNIVRSNKGLKLVQAACDGIRGDPRATDAMAKLQERYYVLCKKAEQRVKNIQHLMIEWKRLNDFLAPTDPKDMDDFTPKQFLIFLKTYALYYA